MKNRLKALAPLLLAAAVSVPCFADQITYDIHFTDSNSGIALTGSFTYDGVQFSNFFVDEGPTSFDLTALANSPLLCLNVPALMCSRSGPDAGFVIMSQSIPGADYFWKLGTAAGGPTPEFQFLASTSTSFTYISDPFPFIIGSEPRFGAWAIRAETAEPGTLSLLGLAGMAFTAIAWQRRKSV